MSSNLSEAPQELYSKSDLIELCRVDFNFFSALALGDQIFESEFPPEYLTAFEMIKESALDLSKTDHKYVFGFPRGHAKTTVAKLIAAWILIFTEKRYILVGCSSEPKAESFIGDVYRVLTSPTFKKLFGDPSESAEKKSQGLKVFSYRGSKRIIQAVGANGDPRGVNIDFARPDVHICDDLQSRENAKSEAESSSLLEWYASTFMYTKSPKGLLHIYIGNTFPYPGSILPKLRENPDYISFIVGAILANGTALWEEVYPKEKLLNDLRSSIKLGKAEVFFSELMNDSKSLTAIGFDYSKIRPWDQDEFSVPAFGFVIIDPANKDPTSDDTAIGVMYYYDDLELPYFREVISEKLSPGETIRESLKLAYKHNIQAIFVENVAYQKSLLYWFNYICQMEGIEGFKFYPISPGAGAKNIRLANSLKRLQQGNIILHPDVEAEVLSQIAQLDLSSTKNKDDILDLIDYAFEIPLKFPGEISLAIRLLTEASAPARSYAPWENSPI